MQIIQFAHVRLQVHTTAEIFCYWHNRHAKKA